MSGFKSLEGDLVDSVFITEITLLDQYVGDKLWIWGNNNYGQLGDNTSTNKSSPVQTIAGGTNWRQVCTGYSLSAGIKTDGTLWLWGKNAYGALGDNTSTNKSSPVQTVTVGTNWKLVSGGGSHVAAIKTDGTLWSWGRNNFGQLGNSSTTNRSSPVQTTAGGTTWRQLSSGYSMSAAIKTDGTLWCWGRNTYGWLGEGSTTTRTSPVQTVAGGSNWAQVSSGYFHAAAIKTDGTLWTWGRNTYGQLGDNTRTNASSPIQTITVGNNWKQVATGYYHMSAIKIDGTLWCWGRNNYGQLGDNTSAHKSSPVQTVAGGSTWKQTSEGNLSSAAIKMDGSLWTWGKNTFGELGDNTTAHKSSPVQTLTGGSNWKQVAGNKTTVAVTNGT